MKFDTETIQVWLETTRPRAAMAFIRRLLFKAALAAMVVVALVGPSFGLANSISLGAPGAVMAGFLLAGWLEGRRRRRLQREVFRAWQHVQLGHEAAALPILEGLFRRPISSSYHRAQAFILIANIAEHHRQYSEAVLIYERLLEEGIPDTALFQEVELACASAKVHNQELTDAVTLINRLARVPLPPAMRAARDLVQLFQQVFMGHYEDAIHDIDDRRALFRRHLSTRAAYGYGLLAAAMHGLGRFEEARRLWSDATTLLRPSRLIEEYALLGEVAGAYPATEHPV